MKITTDIRKAIEIAVEKSDSQRRFAEVVGIRQASIWKYLNGQNNVIRDENWKRLLPHIYEYLPPGYVAKHDPRIATIDETWESKIGSEDAHRYSGVTIITKDNKSTIDIRQKDLIAHFELAGNLLEEWELIPPVIQRQMVNELIKSWVGQMNKRRSSKC